MAYYADPLVALMLEPLTLDYIRSALSQERIDTVVTPEGEVVYRLGQGDLRVMTVTGFSLYSYRLVNSLALMLIASCREARVVRVPGETTLTKITLMMYFPVNKFAYSSTIVSDRKYGRSLMDELGNLVIGDLLTLQSTSASALHSAVTYLRPDVLILLYTEKELSRYMMNEISEPSLCIASLSREIENTMTSALATLMPDFKIVKLSTPDLQLPHTHFHLECAVPLVLVIVLPFRLEAVPYICNCLTGLINMLSEHAESILRLRKRELKERSSVLIHVKPPLTVRKLSRILEQHGLSTSIEEEDKLRVVYYRDIPLHRMLLEDRLIEEYFSVRVVS